MPNTTSEKLTPTRAKFTVTVTQEELEPHLKQAYKTIAEQVSIPGFRKGKVPAPIIDQRVGREAVVEQAVNSSLDDFYRQAVNDSEFVPMGRPTADVDTWIDPKDPESKLVLVYEAEVRPEFTLPAYEGREITVDDAKVDDDAVEERLTELREGFGSLVDVDRAAANSDFVQIDLVARIDGEEVDRASGISYQLGTGNLLEGIDEAVETLTAGETTTFTSQLLGGEHEGQDAEVEVTVAAVQERELPEADDEFAKTASEFETIAELRENLKEEAGKAQVFTQGAQARDLLVESLLEEANIPVSEELVEAEVHRHLEGENRLEDDEHRAEVKEATEKQIALQLLLDAIVEAEKAEPTQQELSQYIVNSASQYGMDPQQFIQALAQSGQMESIIGEVTRNKALALALSKAKVVDQSGNAVDLSEFAAVDSGAEEESEDAEVASESEDEAQS